MSFGNSEVYLILCLLTRQISIWTISWQKTSNYCRYVCITIVSKAQLKQSYFKLDLTLKLSRTCATFLFVSFQVVHLIQWDKFYFCGTEFLIIDCRCWNKWRPSVNFYFSCVTSCSWFVFVFLMYAYFLMMTFSVLFLLPSASCFIWCYLRCFSCCLGASCFSWW